MSQKFSALRERLLQWGQDNRRSYPWRRTTDPYAILIAEFMLHRTQVVQVENVYLRFLERWPTLDAVVAADDEELRTILSSLGLQWRISLMIKALNFLWREYGTVPTDVNSLKAAPGIGPYIANATYCFATNSPITLVDTNTVRVTGRVFGLDLAGEARRRKSIIDTIGRACDPLEPRNYYYSMIDLAHSICTPHAPQCDVCPLQTLPCDYGIKRLNQPAR